MGFDLEVVVILVRGDERRQKLIYTVSWKLVKRFLKWVNAGCLLRTNCAFMYE